MNTTRNVSFVWITFFIFSVIISFSTCKNNIGLGGSVDIEHPRGAITDPDAGETPIRGSFVIKGTARDDEGISSISAVFKNKESGEKTKVFPAEPFTNTAGDIAWTIKIDNESNGIEEGHPLVKVYPIPDGEYEALVTLTDKNGKKTVLNQTYKIDNTPPVFIVSRPSTITGKDETPTVSDGYGAIFTVVGQVGERHTVEKLSVHVDGSGSPIEMTNMFVGKNINAQVAVYSEDNPLYKLQAQNLSQALKSQMFLYDNARQFNGTASAAEGNKAEVYYLRDSIFTAVLQKGYTAEVISDYFAGKKGVGTDDHNKKIRELRGDAEALKALNDRMVKMQDKRSTFKLDPSKSPGFKVVGVRNLPKTGLNPDQASSIMFRSGIETSFIVELVPNKDKTPLVAGYTLDAYRNSSIKIVLLKPTGSLSLSEEAEAFKKGTGLSEKTILKFADITQQMLENDKLITVADGNLRVKCILPADFEAGRYLLKVTGTDTSNLESNTFAAYDDSNTVTDGFNLINFVSTGNGPRIRLIRPHGFYNEKITIEADVGNLDAGGGVYYNIDSAVSETDPNYINQKLDKEYPSQPENLRYKKEIDISHLSDGEHTIYLLAKNGSGGQKDTDNTKFEVDKTPPEVQLNYPNAADPQAGEITISGSITDERAGVKASSTKYIIGKKTPKPETDSAGWQDMTSSNKGSWSITYNLDSVPPSEREDIPSSPYKKIRLYLLVEDEIGNKTVREKEILFNPDGTKPVVKVLSPQAGVTLGGIIQIFGTASAAKGGPAAVGKVYAQFSKSGNFSGSADGTFGTKDWYNGGNGQVITEANALGQHSGAEWRVSINGDKSFNHPAEETQEVYFRLRAENKIYTRMGEWTTPIKIIVDKSAPTIGSPNAVKVDDLASTQPEGSSAARDYTPNMWIGRGKKLIGSLHDEVGIKAVTISSEGLAGRVNYNLSQAQSAGWIEAAAGGNYELKIPLDLDALSPAAKNAGEFSITVSITENKENNPLSSQQPYYFRFDTIDPAGDFGEPLHMDNGTFTINSVNDTLLANAVNTHVSGGASYGDLELLIGSSRVKISGVSGNTVNFTPDLTSPGSYNYILYKKNKLIYNVSGHWIIRGVANDDGSGIKEVKAKVKVNGTFSPEVKMTEADPTNKITKQLGGQATWEGKIDLSTLSDGKGELHYQIIDKGGNTYNVGSAYGGTGAIEVTVKNKPFAVETITLKTDIGGSGVEFENTEQNKALKNVKTDASLNLTADFESTNFAFKNKDNSKIKIKFTGGQGQIKYRLKKGTAVLTGTGLKDITKDSSNEAEIDLKDYIGTGSDKIGNSDGTATEIVLELWDSALGFTPGTNSASATIKIKTLFDALDSEKPVVVILPFHWNSEADNSLYQNSRANGHVEIGDVAGLSAGSSVSGKITVRGFAYDNIQLNTLTVTLPNTTPLAVTATRTANSTNWTSDKNMADHGAELLIEETKYDYLGYYVKWKLEWDTEKAAVGTAKDIKVIANDGTNNSLDSADSASSETTGISRTYDTAEHSDFAGAKPGQFILFTKGEAQHLTRVKSVTGNKIELMNAVDTGFVIATLYKHTTNVPAMSVNVVPYITEIETALKGADGSVKGAFSRASTGEYPVRAGESIKVKGFNLAGGTVHLGTGNLGTTLHNVSISDSHTSGELKVTVGTVDSINNKVDIAKPYNLEGNGINNDILNAKRKLFVWKMEPIINNSAMDSPQFVMDSKSNYYLVFGNLKSFGSGSGAMRLSTKINTDSKDDWEKSYSKFHNTVIAYDTNGKPYLASTNTDRASNSTSFTFCFQAPSGNSNYDVGKNKTRLENCDNQQTNVYDVNRAQIPKMAVKGGGTPADPAKIALVYFDKNVKDDAPLKFRYGTVTGTESWTGTVPNPRIAVTGGIAVNVDSNGGGSDPSGPSSGSAVGYEIVANSSSSFKAGQYAGVALTASNRAIVVWYDAENSKLMYSFRDLGNSYTAPASGGERKTAEWQANAVEIDGGAPLYVDIALDDEENLHIGYYSSSLGGVKYAYLSKDKVTGGSKPTTADFKLAVVDTFMNPGTYLKIGARKETVGTEQKQVPYITYYHNGFYGSANAARMAWLKEGVASDGSVKTGVNEGKFTGEWTVMTVPASSGIQQYTICNGVPMTGTYANKVIAAYFTNKNYEMAVLSKN
ncbi:MAG: hypothetical protein P1P65_02010 [Treponema sp.]